MRQHVMTEAGDRTKFCASFKAKEQKKKKNGPIVSPSNLQAYPVPLSASACLAAAQVAHQVLSVGASGERSASKPQLLSCSRWQRLSVAARDAEVCRSSPRALDHFSATQKLLCTCVASAYPTKPVQRSKTPDFSR